MNPTLRSLLVLLATLAMIAANAFPGARGFRGETVGSISDAYPTLLTPAGYAFAIWSLIYSGLLVFSGVQLLPSRRADPLGARIAPWYVLSCLLNGANNIGATGVRSAGAVGSVDRDTNAPSGRVERACELHSPCWPEIAKTTVRGYNVSTRCP